MFAQAGTQIRLGLPSWGGVPAIHNLLCYTLWLQQNNDASFPTQN